MNRNLHRWMAVALLLLLAGGIVSAQIAQQGRGQAVSPADLQAMQRLYEATQRRQAALQAIAQDKDGFVRDIVARWASAATERGSGDRGLVMLKAGLMQADPEKVFRASEATSYDGLLAVLYGGAPASTAPTLLSSPLTADRTAPTPNALGSSSLDLVYTPINPCRALDSRNASGSYGGVSFTGPYAANSTHTFAVTDPIDFYGSQGGLANCGIPVTAAKGVVLNITVASPAAAGDLRLYPWGTSAPNASILNFNAYTNTANAVVAPICLNCNQDLSVITDYAATHVIVDVLGYFAAPVATAVNTTIVSNLASITAAGAYTADSPACPSGYTLVSGGFSETAASTGNWIWQNGPNGTVWEVKGNNASGGSLSLTVYGICSQVPGR